MTKADPCGVAGGGFSTLSVASVTSKGAIVQGSVMIGLGTHERTPCTIAVASLSCWNCRRRKAGSVHERVLMAAQGIYQALIHAEAERVTLQRAPPALSPRHDQPRRVPTTAAVPCRTLTITVRQMGSTPPAGPRPAGFSPTHNTRSAHAIRSTGCGIVNSWTRSSCTPQVRDSLSARSAFKAVVSRHVD